MKSFVSWGLFGIAALGVLYLLGQMYFIGKSSVLKIADAGNKRQVEAGQKIYVENCASCHGVNLEGQPNWRSQLPEGGLPAPPHDETGHTWHHSDKLNFKYTKKGGQKIAPPEFKSNMPGFEETLSDDQIWAVLAYIKSEWPEQVRRRHALRNKP